MIEKVKSKRNTEKALVIVDSNPNYDKAEKEHSNPIFRLTGVLYQTASEKIIKSLNRKSLQCTTSTTPMVRRTTSTSKKIVATTTPYLKKRFSSLNWTDFLKRNISTGPMPSQVLKEKISEVDYKIDSEINSTQDSLFAKSIKKLDRSANIESQVSDINSYTLAKKELFNEIHEEYIFKLEKLRNLQKMMADLEACDVESKKLENELTSRRNDLAKTRKDLAIENFYSETLRFLLSRSRDLVKKAAIPINGKNEDLFRINLHLKKERRDTKQTQFETKQLKKKIKKLKEEINSEKAEQDQSLNFKLKIYEDQQRLKKCIAIEEQRQEMIKKNQINIKKLQIFEQKIADLKKDDLIEKEIIKLNRHLHNQEQKFRQIQRVTKNSSIDDVLPYYFYLAANKEVLEKSVEDSVAMLSRLASEKTQLTNNYAKQLLEDKTVREENLKISSLESKCCVSEESLSIKETEYEKLNELQLAAVNTLSRLVFQLNHSEGNVTSSNLVHKIGLCLIKLDKIIESIQNYQSVYYIESINTDIQYNLSPSFLNLNTVIQNYRKADV